MSKTYEKILKKFNELRTTDTYFDDDRAWIKAVCIEIDELKEEMLSTFCNDTWCDKRIKKDDLVEVNH